MFDLILRVVVIVVGLVACCVVLCVRHERRKDRRWFGRHESLRMLGGALLCLSVSSGTLGVLLGWDTVWRLPFTAVTVAWVAYGGIHEFLEIKRRAKR